MPDLRYRLLLIIAICIGISIYSCQQPNQPASLKDADYNNFLDTTLRNYDITKAGRYIIVVDSFYSKINNVSDYGAHIKYVYKTLYYNDRAQFDSAAVNVDKAVAVLEKNKLEKKYAKEYLGALNLKGRIRYSLGNFTQAYNIYFKVKQLAEESKDTCTLGEYNYCVGMISYKQKKYAEAENHFKQAFICSHTCKGEDAYRQQENLDNIALSLEKQALYDSAIYYYDSAIRYINTFLIKNPDTIMYGKAIGVVYGNIGSIWLAKGIPDSAIVYLKKGYDMNIRRAFENKDAVLVHLKLANAYLQKQEYPLALTALTNTKKELDSVMHSVEANTTWNQLMYRYYEQTKNEPEAYRYYHEYTKMRDSLWETEKVQLQTDIRRELNEKDQAYKIGLLQKQNQLSNLYLWVTVIFLAMAVVIVILTYKINRRSKKNIEELTALNDQVTLQKAELEKKNKEKDRILHVVAHDLRNPVGGISMLTEMLAVEDPDSPDFKEALVLIKNASQSALALINELLGHTDANSEMSKEQVDIARLIQESTRLLQFKADEKKQRIVVDVLPAPLVISANREKITRVLNNLIGNAIKFSPEGAAIEVTLIRKDKFALISVKDNGIGIPADLQGSVFDMFTVSKRPGTAGEKSFGLGLSICRQIVEAHGGGILYDSKEGEGTTFYVSLPI